jgi:hypothetical protein
MHGRVDRESGRINYAALQRFTCSVTPLSLHTKHDLDLCLSRSEVEKCTSFSHVEEASVATNNAREERYPFPAFVPGQGLLFSGVMQSQVVVIRPMDKQDYQ